LRRYPFQFGLQDLFVNPNADDALNES
jgi:hypothetical protein